MPNKGKPISWKAYNAKKKQEELKEDYIMVENADLESFEVGKLPEEDTVQEAIITEVLDGKIKDFVKELTKWKNPDDRCINVTAETKFDGTTMFTNQIFTYQIINKRKFIPPRSSLFKFKFKYGGLPKLGMKVKVQANQDGYFKLIYK